MTNATAETDLVNSPGKVVVADLLRRLPDDVSLAEIADEIEILIALKEGLIESRAGKTVPHEEFEKEVRAWLSK